MLKKVLNMNKWYLYNFVFYDGVDAFVSKFIVPENTSLENARELISKMGYDGELLKIDRLYPLTFDNIVAMRDGNNSERCTFERFHDMYF